MTPDLKICAPIARTVVSCLDPEGTLCAAASLDHVYCMLAPREGQERWESFVQVETLKPRRALCMRIRSNRNNLPSSESAGHLNSRFDNHVKVFDGISGYS